jgi:hypothetical protein
MHLYAVTQINVLHIEEEKWSRRRSRRRRRRGGRENLRK